MAKTIGQIINWVDTCVANKIASSDKIVFLSDLLGDGEFKLYNTELITNSTKTSTSSYLYNLPSGVRVQDLFYVGISGTTYNSTDVLGSTTIFTEYKYAGIRDSRGGSVYWNESSQIAIPRATTDVYHMKYVYRPHYGAYTNSSDSTTIIAADTPLINWLQHKLSARVCKASPFPRLDLANNYELDAMNAMSEAKINYFKQRRKTSKVNIGYKDWWV